MSGEDILRSDRTDQKIDPSGSTVETLKEGLSAASSKLQQVASRKGQELKEQGQDMIGRQKDEIADRICGIGCAVKRAAIKLRESDDQTLADTTEGIASRIEDASTYVRDHSLGEMLQDVEDFTKRHSTLVLGGLFLGGVALARFLKASRPNREPDFEPVGGEMRFGQDEDIDLGGNIYEEPRFEETPLSDARFGGIGPRDTGPDLRGSGTGFEGSGLGRPDGLEAEGFGKSSAAKIPEADIGARDQSEVGVNVGRTQSAPPNLQTSSSSGFDQRPAERLDDSEPGGRKF